MKTQNLVKELKQSGIRAAVYKRPPIGRDVFALTILPNHPEGVVTVNQGKAKVRVAGDRKKRQAAVSVYEPARVVTRKVQWTPASYDKPTREQIRYNLRQRFPVVIPIGASWSFRDISVTELQPSVEERVRNEERKAMGSLPLRYWRASGTVTARVGKKTVNHFLIGMDETRNFVSPLPKRATSVEMAHRLLKPARLRRGSLRQGEWFFSPVSRAVEKALNKREAEDPLAVMRIRLGRTTHTAKSAIVMPSYTVYARGYITDNRKGHHRPLFLPTWHRVVRNREVAIKVGQQGQRQTWD